MVMLMMMWSCWLAHLSMLAEVSGFYNITAVISFDNIISVVVMAICGLYVLVVLIFSIIARWLEVMWDIIGVSFVIESELHKFV